MPYVELDELLAQSDFISLHAPAVDGGALICNAENIAKMKDGVVIINTSRGANVDEAALLAALESGKVRAAGLDVYADEPASQRGSVQPPHGVLHPPHRRRHRGGSEAHRRGDRGHHCRYVTCLGGAVPRPLLPAQCFSSRHSRCGRS